MGALAIHPTFGVWLPCIWVQTLLQGCGMLQAFLYFHWYPNDVWGLKAMVAFLVVIETFQIIVFFQVTYSYLIDHFGDVTNLWVIYWQDSAQLFATYLSAFVVQLYFAHCIYALDKSRKILVGFILLLAFTAISAGIGQTIITLRLHKFTELQSTKPVITLQAAATFCCDILITLTLLLTLESHKGRMKRTNTLLRNLMIVAVNRGALTAICALLNMILFIAKPNTFYFFIGLELSSKLYMNSALATLNSRKYIVARALGDDSDVQWPVMSNVPRVEHDRVTQYSEEPPSLHILVEQHIRTDSPDQDTKKIQLAEGIALAL